MWAVPIPALFTLLKIACASRGGTIHAMPAPAPSLAYLDDRCCLTCGYRGRELQGRRGQDRLVCPRCRQDLYARPIRSYAEMEGLSEPTTSAALEPRPHGHRRLSLLRFAGEVLGAGLMLVRPASKTAARAARHSEPESSGTMAGRQR